MTKIIDFRSDTVTLPTQEMLQAITNAKLGDDVLGEDPTVVALEEKSAKMFGKEAGLLVTSGTQGNLISILAQTERGSEVIMEAEAHTVLHEVGGVSALGGVSVRTVVGLHGYPSPEDVRRAIRSKNIHYPQTRLICLENTHNRAGGVAFSREQTDALGKVAEESKLGFHIDGARIFNASIALNTSVKDLTARATSVSYCLSKGLSCPVGSVIVGTREMIDRARKIRKMLGGGMRQAGIIAAPGLIALENIGRLKEDHENARLLARGVNSFASSRKPIEASTPQTNIVLVKTAVPETIVLERMKEVGILAFDVAPNRIRFVTHRMITKDDVEEALRRLEPLVRQL